MMVLFWTGVGWMTRDDAGRYVYTDLTQADGEWAFGHLHLSFLDEYEVAAIQELANLVQRDRERAEIEAHRWAVARADRRARVRRFFEPVIVLARLLLVASPLLVFWALVVLFALYGPKG